ncbi:DUF7064 domain-containing protein [Phytohabitans houttuyneae]|uniref:DUF7064 domain-containing protein n=1 Tax=Phytohabitans houttuyneae TaxID=1076126 RepID=A0A6V8KIU6_9ACTN|nr:hypothetical protein [Phytohabitans houttuyneae]GFJ82371.1 hypothetical protein Phou_065510 [Phytohabitans houttuyneae]
MSMFAETIAPEHEYRHVPDDQPAYNESTYYNFCCPEAGVVGWMRVAMQPNQPAGQAGVLVFLPDGETLFGYERTTSVPAAGLAVGGLAFDILEPHRRQRLSFDGPLSSFADPTVLATPGTAFREAPKRETRIRLSVTGNGASFGTNGETPENVLEDSLAIGHYEQFIHVDGELAAGDLSLRLRGGGLRDHSWGPRDWAGPVLYRWITAAFDDGSAVMTLDVLRRDGVRTRRAAAVSGGVATQAELTDLSVEWTADGFCRRAVCEVGTAGGPVTLTGTARAPERFVPLRHRRTTEDGTELVTRIGYSAYEFVTSDGRRGLGVVEMLDQMVDGRPIGMAATAAAGPLPRA